MSHFSWRFANLIVSFWTQKILSGIHSFFLGEMSEFTSQLLQWIQIGWFAKFSGLCSWPEQMNIAQVCKIIQCQLFLIPLEDEMRIWMNANWNCMWVLQILVCLQFFVRRIYVEFLVFEILEDFKYFHDFEIGNLIFCVSNLKQRETLCSRIEDHKQIFYIRFWNMKFNFLLKI